MCMKFNSLLFTRKKKSHLICLTIEDDAVDEDDGFSDSVAFIESSPDNTLEVNNNVVNPVSSENIECLIE